MGVCHVYVVVAARNEVARRVSHDHKERSQAFLQTRFSCEQCSAEKSESGNLRETEKNHIESFESPGIKVNSVPASDGLKVAGKSGNRPMFPLSNGTCNIRLLKPRNYRSSCVAQFSSAAITCDFF